MFRLNAEWVVRDYTGKVWNNKSMTSTGFKHRNLVIKKNQLQPNTTYNFTLRISYSDEPEEKATFVLMKKTSLSPTGGKCNVL